MIIQKVLYQIYRSTLTNMLPPPSAAATAAAAIIIISITIMLSVQFRVT